METHVLLNEFADANDAVLCVFSDKEKAEKYLEVLKEFNKVRLKTGSILTKRFVVDERAGAKLVDAYCMRLALTRAKSWFRHCKPGMCEVFKIPTIWWNDRSKTEQVILNTMDDAQVLCYETLDIEPALILLREKAKALGLDWAVGPPDKVEYEIHGTSRLYYVWGKP